MAQSFGLKLAVYLIGSNLFTFVVSVWRYMVRALQFASCWIFHQIDGLQPVVRASPVASCFRYFSLGNSHVPILSSLKNLVNPLRAGITRLVLGASQ